MADWIDDAQAENEAHLERCLLHRRPEGPAPTGYCLNPTCELDLPDGQRWCDAQCRDEWERRRGER